MGSWTGVPMKKVAGECILYVIMGCAIQLTPGGGTTTLPLNPIKAHLQLKPDTKTSLIL